MNNNNNTDTTAFVPYSEDNCSEEILSLVRFSAYPHVPYNEPSIIHEWTFGEAKLQIWLAISKRNKPKWCFYTRFNNLDFYWYCKAKADLHLRKTAHNHTVLQMISKGPNEWKEKIHLDWDFGHPFGVSVLEWIWNANVRWTKGPNGFHKRDLWC